MRLKTFLSFWLLINPFIALIMLYFFKSSIQLWLQGSLDNMIFGSLLCIPLILLGLLPTSIFTFVMVYVNQYEGMLFSLIVYAFSLWLSYYWRYLISVKSILTYLPNRWQAGVKQMEQNWMLKVQDIRLHGKICFWARLNPIVPFALTNILLIEMPVTLRQYFISGYLGMLPRWALIVWGSFFMLALGQDISLHPARLNFWEYIVSFSLIVLSSWSLKRIFN